MIPIITAPFVVHNNNVQQQQERERQENDYTDDVLLSNMVFIDDGFVTKSKMTTDEAIVIKNGILTRIQEKYGNQFTTTSVVLIKDSKIVAEEIRQAQAIQKKIDDYFMIIAWGFVFFLTMIIIYKSITERD